MSQCGQCKGKRYTPPILAGFGNPLLDVYVVITDQSLLDKYKLSSNDQAEMEKELFSCLYNEVMSSCNEVKRYPGGSVQNTLRIFQWLVQSPCTLLFGGIGNDEPGKLVKNIVEDAGVQTRYALHEEYPTGICLALVNGEDRLLVAHLGAANIYRTHDLDIPENWEILRNVFVVYVEGYFITHDCPTAVKLLDFCANHGICFVFNLSASYVCENFVNNILEIIPHADVIFGNSSEYITLSKIMKWDSESVPDVFHKIKSLNKSHEKTKEKKEYIPRVLKRGPVFVSTAGKGQILVDNGDLFEFPVPQLEKKCVKDTTGAGDAFVAGFLAGAFGDCDLEGCVKWGSWTAQQVIQQIGVGNPNQRPTELVVPFK